MPQTSSHQTQRPTNRLWRALRCFVNSTLVLFIILVAALLWLVNSTQNFVVDTLGEVKVGLLQDMDGDARQLIADMRSNATELKTLRGDIARIADDPSALIDPEMRATLVAVEQDVDRIALNLERISSGQFEIAQEALETLAVSAVRAYGDIRGCVSSGTSHTTQTLSTQ
ncbi:MAG: hypothetical protein AAGC96_03210 [Pseudomonadota bacterium]